MATVAFVAGFETQAALTEGATFIGTIAISSTQHRTGSWSLRCNPASGAAANAQFSFTNRYVHFGLFVATLPSLTRVLIGTSGAGVTNLALNSDGTLSVRSGTTVAGSSAALLTGVWYWIGFYTGTTDTNLLQVDGVTVVTGTNGTIPGANFGVPGSEASAIDIYYDDLVFTSDAFIPPSNVGLAIPISDNSVGSGWTTGAGGATSLFAAVDHTPPVGVADPGTATSQIRNAGANLNAYAANLTTYTNVGVGPNDLVQAVAPFLATGALVNTSAKSGSATLSNPTLVKTSFGAFSAGAACGTFPSNWKNAAASGLLIASLPSVTLGSSPVLTVTQDTSSTRVADVCFMGAYVVWTPGALGVIDEPGVFAGRGPRNVSQGINRASSY